MAEVRMDLSWDNLDEAFASLEAEVTDVVRGLSVQLFQQVVNRTPQYYGRMVASYSYSLNTPVFVDRSHLFGDEIDGVFVPKPWVKVSSKGGVKGINAASMFNLGKPSGFKLGDTVYISNGADHAMGVESGNIELRSVNRPGNAAQRAVTALSALYSKGMSHNTALKMRASQITDY